MQFRIVTKNFKVLIIKAVQNVHHVYRENAKFKISKLMGNILFIYFKYALFKYWKCKHVKI